MIEKISTETATPSIKDLLKESAQVDNWYKLGVELGIPSINLDHIESIYDKKDFVNLKKSVFIKWLLLDPNPSWKKLSSALKRMGLRDLSTRLRIKYRTGN